MKNFLTILALLIVGGLYAVPEKRSPFCDCGADCKCSPDCECTPTLADNSKLPAEPAAQLSTLPADTAPTITPAEAQQVAAIVDEPKFTQPEPAKPAPKPQAAPTKKAAPVAGHYEYRQSCGPNGCSVQQVWVPHTQAAPVYQQQYGSCGPGGCGVRRGLFGRRR